MCERGNQMIRSVVRHMQSIAHTGNVRCQYLSLSLLLLITFSQTYELTSTLHTHGLYSNYDDNNNNNNAINSIAAAAAAATTATTMTAMMMMISNDLYGARRERQRETV